MKIIYTENAWHIDVYTLYTIINGGINYNTEAMTLTIKQKYNFLVGHYSRIGNRLDNIRFVKFNADLTGYLSKPWNDQDPVDWATEKRRKGDSRWNVTCVIVGKGGGGGTRFFYSNATRLFIYRTIYSSTLPLV